MLRFLLLFAFFFTVLSANKVIYTSYVDVPKRVIQGQIFTVTLKTLTTVKQYDDIQYTIKNTNGIRFLNRVPYREHKGKFFYDTFYLYVTKKRAFIPDINVSLVANQTYESTLIPKQPLNVIALNPNKYFSNIVANDFNLLNFKTTSYDEQHNIVVFSATATNANLKAIHFQDVYKQGIESIKPSYTKEAKITYFVVIDKQLERFRFNYFNLIKNKFVTIDIPIVVDDDSVATQSDLKPKDQSHETIKMYIALAIALVGFVFIVIRKKYIYLVFIIVPLGYALWISAPQEEICVQQGAQIHLLPVDNGTIFNVTPSQKTFLKEGSAEGYTKIRLENDKIGWVKNENLCSH